MNPKYCRDKSRIKYNSSNIYFFALTKLLKKKRNIWLSSMNDEELIQKIAAKDHFAFKKLVERYQALVISICYNLLGNQQHAEDVAQEAFLQVYKSAKKFRHKCKFSTWIYRIAVNRSLNFIRYNKKFRWTKSFSSLQENQPKRTTDFLASNSTGPDIALEEKEQREMLQKAMDSLPKNQKVVFILHKHEGLSYKEISKILKISLSSVEARIHRAKINLQKKLIPYLKKI